MILPISTCAVISKAHKNTLISDDVIYHEAKEKNLTRTCGNHEFDKSFWDQTIIQVMIEFLHY